MSLDAIRLRNFRGFKDVTLELKPLTVLLGPNSSGKSSFGHALAAAAHCQRRDTGSQRPTLSAHGDGDEWPVDLGTTASLRTSGEKGRVFIGFRIKSGWVELGFGELEPDKTDLALSHISHPFVAPHQSDVVVIEKNKEISRSRNIALERQNLSTWWDDTTKELSSVDLDGLLIRSMQHIGRTSYAPAAHVQETIRSFLGTLTYLRGTRKRPSRAYEDNFGRWQRIGYSGEWTPAVLHHQAADRISYAQPPSIPSSPENVGASLDQVWNPQEHTLVEGVGFWLVQLGLAESVHAVRSDDNRFIQVRVTISGQQAHDVTDVGFGVSQVLPILVAGLLQPVGSVFVVDLPEAHLHPLPQARLADFFCSLALTGRQVLIETHSEMFFHWLRLRAELHRDLKDLVAVYFIDRSKEGRCSEPQAVGITGDAQLRWPLGFFEEGWDIETRIRSIRDARSAARK